MIQRIQSLYLLAVTILMAITFAAPLLAFGTTEGVSTLYTYRLIHAAGNSETAPYYLSFLVIIATILPFITIFGYKKRLIQIRWCVVEMVLLAGTIVMLGLYCYRFYTLFQEASPAIFSASFKLTLCCPAVALFLTWLASRAIFRDEMLVRDTERIR
ncbi:MAG: DUF4293 family protein [Rikenellaceae bacterium]|nr:DUF4293 family protein [Rikenellaceae bacterium]